MRLRVASFNVENLFGRAKVFNFRDHTIGDKILERIDDLRNLLKKDTYTANDKKEITRLYNKELKDYIEIREDRGKLFRRRGRAVTGVAANGLNDWDGTDDSGRNLPGGVYFVQLETAKYNITKKNIKLS